MASCKPRSFLSITTANKPHSALLCPNADTQKPRNVQSLLKSTAPDLLATQVKREVYLPELSAAVLVVAQRLQLSIAFAPFAFRRHVLYGAVLGIRHAEHSSANKQLVASSEAAKARGRGTVQGLGNRGQPHADGVNQHVTVVGGGVFKAKPAQKLSAHITNDFFLRSHVSSY